jgi:pilus assembly protein CpaB
MNRTRIVMVFGVAVLLGLLASLGVYRFLAQKGRMAEQARLQTVGIVVASGDIPLGSTITADQVAIAAWPKDRYPKDALSDVKSVAGKVAMREFVRGEPVVESKLVPTQQVGGVLSLKIPPGMRAFSVRVDEVVGVGGFIVPDARVDVIVTTSGAGREEEQISKIVLENIQVLAVGQIMEQIKEQKGSKPAAVHTVTLAVLPEDAEKLALASNDGRIQLVLRNFADAGKVRTPGITKGRLLSSLRDAPASTEMTVDRPKKKRPEKRAVAPPVERKKFVVEVIRGSKRSEEVFE